MIEQIFILAAGQGSRMRPLTNDRPKPLVKVNGKTMLDRIFDKINQIPSINRIVVNGFYLSQQVQSHLENLNDDRIIFSHEVAKIETGGGLIQALPLFDKNKPILIINGDIVWQGDAVSSLINNFNDETSDILLGLKKKEEFFGYQGNGDFNLNEESKDLTRGEEPDFVYTGLQIFHPRVIDGLNLPTPPFSLSYFFKEPEKKNIRLKGIELQDEFFHIGTVKDLEKYQDKVDS